MTTCSSTVGLATTASSLREMSGCPKCGLPRLRQCSRCGAEWRDATAILSEAGDLEVGHGSHTGCRVNELYLMGDIPPARKGQHQSAKTLVVLQKYSKIIQELKELDKLVQEVQNSRKGRPSFLPLCPSALAEMGKGLSATRKWAVRTKNLARALFRARGSTAQ